MPLLVGLTWWCSKMDWLLQERKNPSSPSCFKRRWDRMHPTFSRAKLGTLGRCTLGLGDSCQMSVEAGRLRLSFETVSSPESE